MKWIIPNIITFTTLIKQNKENKMDNIVTFNTLINKINIKSNIIPEKYEQTQLKIQQICLG